MKSNKRSLAVFMIIAIVTCLTGIQKAEAYSVNEVHLNNGDVYDITSCPKNTIIYIDDNTASSNNRGEVTLEGSSEKVWVDISVSKGKTVNVKLADGLTITPRYDSAYGTGDNDDTLGWSVAGIYINETKRAGGVVLLTSEKDAKVIVESYMRTNWQPVPAIMKNDTKTKLVFRTEDPSSPGTIIARIVKGGDFGGACAIGAYGHGVGNSATSSYTVGNIEFQSGNIEAYGYRDGPGIGAYSFSNVRDLDFTGAHVKAYAGDNPYVASSAESGGAGIGTANPGNVGTITISGGYVEAYGRGATKDSKGWPLRYMLPYCGPGIGVGAKGHLDEINISGGTVVAYGGSCDHDNSNSCSASGIGTAVYDTDNVYGWSSADKITITGGDITARGGDRACGIGGCVDKITIAPDSSDTELKIDAGIDDRKDRDGNRHAVGAGIGIANNAKDSVFSKYSGKITIKGGDITASAGNIAYSGYSGTASFGGGIGPTYSGKVSSINISGGKIQTAGGVNSPGIGGYSRVSGDMGTLQSIYISGGTITATKASYSGKSGEPLSGIGGCKNGNGDRTDIVITGGSIIANGDNLMNTIGYDTQPKNDKGEYLYGTIFKYSPDVDEWTEINSFTTDPELDYDYGLNDVYTNEGIDDEEGEVITEFWLPESGEEPLGGYICKVYMEDRNYGSFIEGTNNTYKIAAGYKGTLTAFTDIAYTSWNEDYKYSGKGICVYGSRYLTVDPEPQDTDLYRFLYYVDYNDHTIADRAATLRDRTDYTDLDGAWNTTIKNLVLHPEVQQTGYTISFDKNKPSDASHNIEGSWMPDMTENVFDEFPIDLPASTYSLAGWTFTGWNTEADGSGTHFDDAGKFRRNSDWGAHVILYAQWEPKTYTVTFDPGDATGQDTYTQEFQYDKAQKLTANRFTYDGHGFVGWNTLAFGSFYEDEATVINRCVLNEDGSLSGMSFYAKWFEEDNLAIVIIDDGQKVNSADPSCITLKSGSLTIPADIQKSEFGYYVNNLPEGTYTVEFTGDLAVYEPYGEVEVVAGKMSLYCLNYYKVTAHETEYCYSFFDGDPHKTTIEHVAANTRLNINTGISNTLHKFAGYTSTGAEPTWEDGDKTKAAQTITVNGSADIYPTDAPIQYHVAFEQNKPDNASHDVEGSMENQTFTYGEEQGLIQNTYKLTNWTFIGWNTKADGSGKSYADEEMVKNLSPVDEGIAYLYAQWRPNKYKVIFIATNATGGSMEPQEYEYDVAQKLKPNAFERTDWSFTSWNTEPTGSGTTFEDEAEVKNLTQGKSITLYAQWEHDYYTVNFDKNDNEATGEMEEEHIWTNCGYELPLCSFAKKGYSFVSWNTKADGSGTSYGNGEAVENLTEKGRTVTLYAQWKAKTYKITYKDPYGMCETEEQTVNYNDHVNLLAADASGWQPAGHTLRGWESEALGSFYDPGQEVTNLCSFNDDGSLAGTTLYAVWNDEGSITVSLTLDDAGIDVDPDEITLTGSDGTIYAKCFIKSEVKLGTYMFFSDDPEIASHGNGKLPDGTYTISVPGVDIPADKAVFEYGSTKAISLVYDFRTVTVKADDHIDSADVNGENSIVVLKGTKVHIKATVEEGYNFDGWSWLGDDGKPADLDAAAAEQDITADRTIKLTAHAENNVYKVVFSPNDDAYPNTEAATGTMEDQDMVVGEPQNLFTNKFVKKGYLFDGWNTKPDGSGDSFEDGERVQDLCSASGGRLTLYAQWNARTYKIFYKDPLGLCETQEQTATYNEPIKLLAADASGWKPAGHTLVGWESDAVGSLYEPGKEVVNVCQVNEDGTLTGKDLYAVWADDGSIIVSVTLDDEGMDIDPDDIQLTDSSGTTFKGCFVKSDRTRGIYTYNMEIEEDPAVEGAVTDDGDAFNGDEMLPEEEGLQSGEDATADDEESGDGQNTGRSSSGGEIPAHDQLPAGEGQGDGASAGDNANFVDDTPAEGNQGDDAVLDVADSTAANTTVGSMNISQTIAMVDAEDIISFFPAHPSDVGLALGTLAAGRTAGRLPEGEYTVQVLNYKSYGLADVRKKISYREDQEYASWAYLASDTIRIESGAHVASATLTDPESGAEMDQAVVPEGAKVDIKAIVDEEGYHFDSYAYSGIAPEMSMEVSDQQVTVRGPVTLYAQASPNSYYVHFDANGGEGEMADQLMTYDAESKLVAGTYKRTHYDFRGWNDSADGSGTAYDDKATVKNLTSEDGGIVTLYAQWQKIPEFTVTFETNGGRKVDPQTVEIHQKAQKPDDPTREHFNFDGWYADEALTQPYDFSQEVTEDITLYAKWNHIKHKITYDLNGGSLDGKTGKIVVEVYEGDVIEIMDAPARKGYTFKYWKGSEYNPGDDYLVEEDHTLTAEWKKIKGPNPDDPDNPNNNGGTKTGDESHILLWIMLMTISLIGLTGIILSRHRHTR